MSSYEIKIKRIDHHPDPSEQDTVKEVAVLICDNDKQLDGVISFIEGLKEDDGLIKTVLHHEHYDESVVVVVKSAGRASLSMIQRRFNIPYTEAASIMAMMVTNGIIQDLDGEYSVL